MIYQDLENVPAQLEEDVIDKALQLPDDEEEDLSEYTFAKFAATYFQGNATYTYVRRQLKQPLLFHEDEGDQLVRKPFVTNILKFAQQELLISKYVVP